AEVEAATKLRAAEAPANAKLRRAEVEAEAKLAQADIDAENKLAQAETDAEAVLWQAAQELAHDRDVFEPFFAMSIDMMCMSTPDGCFTRVSRSFDELGYSREALMARPFLELVHPEDRSATDAAWKALVAGGATISFENRCRCNDGSYRWLSWASGMDASGIVYSTARDVTEARGNLDALIRANAAADDMNRELESFSASVAHDLRAPLRSIDGFSQALLEDHLDKLDATGQKHLLFIRQSAKHMSQLIDDLLALSHMARREMHCQTIDLGAMARTVIARLRAAEPGRHVDVRIEPDLMARGDPRLLAIVLDNLLGNAWKFTARRANAHIELGVTADRDPPEYFVRDNGAGFDMALAGRLFGVFQRLHTTAEFEGHGVGLATVERIVRRHGGRVWAEGEVEHGATFHFTLHRPEPATDEIIEPTAPGYDEASARATAAP
ncbi:MAG: ATP-binding protein, partial [Kofleriaceae bacterium]